MSQKSQKAIKEENIKKISDLLAAGTTKEEIIKDCENFGVSKATIKNYIREIEMSKEKEVVEPVEEVRTPKLEMSANGKNVDVESHEWTDKTGADANFIWVALENIQFHPKTQKRTSTSFIQPYNPKTWKMAKEHMGSLDYVVLQNKYAK